MADNSHRSQAIPQFLSIAGRVVAELTVDGILDRRTWQTLRKPELSIGYDLSLLYEAQRRGATIARNRDESGGITYVAPITRIWELGFKRDFGWGAQIFLPLPLWDVIHKDGRIIPANIDEPPAGPQLSLFGESV